MLIGKIYIHKKINSQVEVKLVLQSNKVSGLYTVLMVANLIKVYVDS